MVAQVIALLASPAAGEEATHLRRFGVRRLSWQGTLDLPSSGRLRGNALQRSGRYNVTFMLGLVYSAVAYVRSPVGSFVEELRRELHPAHTHADAHLTVLPPRPLRGSEQQALGVLSEVCQTVVPFEITMGDVESFVPITPTVFLRVARGAYRMRELHDQLNQGALAYEEPWPYMPHLTIVKTDTVEEALKAEVIARQRWRANAGTRTVRIDSLTFVKGNGERWLDLETVRLSGVASISPGQR